ncbi:MAG: ATP-binding protein [Anaeromyxobacter sp.]
MNALSRGWARLSASLQARVLIPTALLFAATLVAMVVAAVRWYGADLERARVERAEIYARMTATGVSNVMLAGRPADVPAILGTLTAHRSDLISASLIAPTGRVSVSSERSRLGAVPWPDLPGGEATRVLSPPGVTSEFAVLAPVPRSQACARCHDAGQPVGGWVELRFSRLPVVEAQGQLARTLGLSAFLALICLLAIALWLLGREVVSPLQRLVAAMQRAEAGDRTVRADEGRPDELGTAARGFDATLAALRRSQVELEAFYRERMVQADRFAAVGALATGLAHEIKNPLAGLSGALELMAEDLATDAHKAEVVAEMRHQVVRLTGTMESLLGFARPPRVELRPTDLNAALQKALFLIRQQHRDDGIAVRTELCPDLPPVRGDASQLEQVFLNICLNACQAMAGAGGTLAVRSRADGEVLMVEVEDSGPGIPAEVRKQVFSPFFTTKRQGTGLGLAISARIVAEHGGHIGYRCPPEGGTVFTVSLPQARPPSRPEPAP